MSGNETELEPWHKRVKGPFPERYGCVGVKEDGGGSMRGRGTVGAMRVHRATFNRNAALVRELCANGEDVNEVDGAGSTPIMCAAYEGWAEGVDLLVELGAKVNASNNAGDTAYAWAENMQNEEAMERLKHHGAGTKASETERRVFSLPGGTRRAGARRDGRRARHLSARTRDDDGNDDAIAIDRGHCVLFHHLHLPRRRLDFVGLRRRRVYL